MKDRTKFLLMCLAHFVADGAAVATLYKITQDIYTTAIAVILYDILAFTVQPLLGIMTDFKKVASLFLVSGLLLIAFGSFISFIGIVAQAVFLGFGNALAHVGGFAIAKSASKDDMTSLGLFVAPGALGVGIGTLFPEVSVALAILSAIVALIYALYYFFGKERIFVPVVSLKKPDVFRVDWVLLSVVLIVVLLRGFCGTIATGQYIVSGTSGQLAIYLAIFLGKAVGGFLADRIGIVRITMVGFFPSLIGLVFFRDVEILYVFSIFLFNFTMPLTLFMAIRALRGFPVFAFGMTAAILFLGTYVGDWLKNVFRAPWYLILALLAISVCGIVYSYQRTVKNIQREKGGLSNVS
ncbi:MAG TPA: hypothetical protein PLM51_04665 [Bacillota bacterium]|nr:hypothetical protein [Bacillota bacterium]